MSAAEKGGLEDWLHPGCCGAALGRKKRAGSSARRCVGEKIPGRIGVLSPPLFPPGRPGDLPGKSDSGRVADRFAQSGHAVLFRQDRSAAQTGEVSGGIQNLS